MADLIREPAGSQATVERSEMRASISDMIRIPVPRTSTCRGLAQIEAADTADEQVADGKVKDPHTTLTIE